MPTRADEMLQMLDSPDTQIRARALVLLGHEQHMLPLDQLTQLYDAGDTGIRIAVLKYLIRNLPPGHHKIVLKALTDTANSVRLEAVEYLTKYPNVSAAPILETLLKNLNFPRKDLVIRALEVCDDGRAVSLLLPILEIPNHPQRLIASSTIGKLNAQPIIARLLQHLASDDEMTAFMAILALTNVTDGQIIEPTLIVTDRWWSSSTSRIAYEAIHILYKFRDPRIRDALLQLLTNKPNLPSSNGEMARISAIHVLGNYPEPQVILYFDKLLQNGDQSERSGVTYAFTKIGGAEAVDVLIANLPLETDPIILTNYSYAFASLGDKRAVPVLEDLLTRVDSQTKSSIETNLRCLNAILSKAL